MALQFCESGPYTVGQQAIGVVLGLQSAEKSFFAMVDVGDGTAEGFAVGRLTVRSGTRGRRFQVGRQVGVPIGAQQSGCEEPVYALVRRSART